MKQKNSLINFLYILFTTFISNTVIGINVVHQLQEKNIWSTVTPEFSCFNIDYGKLNNTGILNMDFTDPPLISYSSSLSNSLLRLGGSDANKVIYTGFDGNKCPGNYSLCIGPTKLAQIVKFAKNTGLNILFDLNILGDDDVQRNWTFTKNNIAGFLGYIREHYPDVIYAFELGNENQGVINANETVKRFNDLRTIINDLWGDGGQYRRPLLFGPSCHILTDWIIDFVIELGDGVLDAFSYHLYVGYGPAKKLTTQIYSQEYLDTTKALILETVMSVRKEKSVLPIMITETAAAWHGGALNITNSFKSGFWYLDSLGWSAYIGHSALCRQTLLGNNYSLLDYNVETGEYFANPDYFVLKLWHDLVLSGGDGAIKNKTYMLGSLRQPVIGDDTHHDFTGYSFCYSGGGLILAFINTGDENYDIEIRTDGHFNQLNREEYVLQAYGGDLSSRNVLLNGKLVISYNGTIPSLPPRIVSYNSSVSGKLFQAPHKSYGFVVYPLANISVCL